MCSIIKYLVVKGIVNGRLYGKRLSEGTWTGGHVYLHVNLDYKGLIVQHYNAIFIFTN